MRFGFRLKVAVIILLVTLFDRLFPFDFSGACIGLFAAACVCGLAIGRPDVRRSRTAWLAAAAALLFCVSLFDDPGLLAWTMFWCALSMAALLPRTAGFDDAWRWMVRLVLQALTGLAAPFRDLRIIRRCRAGRSNGGARLTAGVLAMPLIGTAIFIALFASANPLIADALARIRLPSIWRVLIWTFVAICLWPVFRPHRWVVRLTAAMPDAELRLPGTSLPSVVIALALFNLVFAVQNLLDVTFLWSGAPLPDGMSMTEYVHRGAYPLIATTLLAGFLALAMLKPGSASAASPVARGLVSLWVAQNLVLVASSALRTIDYIQASMLTSWRIAALAWMALVALGLVLICWRILRGLSARWLINTNASAALLVLTVGAFVDLQAIAADWNVQAPQPQRIDLCYLQRMGDPALLPLIVLERRPLDPVTRDRVRFVREQLFTDLEARQSGWTDWTPHGARRLARARALLGPTPPQPAAQGQGWRGCGGAINRPPAVETAYPS